MHITDADLARAVRSVQLEAAVRAFAAGELRDDAELQSITITVERDDPIIEIVYRDRHGDMSGESL